MPCLASAVDYAGPHQSTRPTEQNARKGAIWDRPDRKDGHSTLLGTLGGRYAVRRSRRDITATGPDRASNTGHHTAGPVSKPTMGRCGADALRIGCFGPYRGHGGWGLVQQFGFLPSQVVLRLRLLRMPLGCTGVERKIILTAMSVGIAGANSGLSSNRREPFSFGGVG